MKMRGIPCIERIVSFPADMEMSCRELSGHLTENRFHMEDVNMYFDVIAKVVADRIGVDPSTIKPESTFADLGIDSLDTVDLLMSLEDELGVEIDLEEPVATIADLDKFIQSKKG